MDPAGRDSTETLLGFVRTLRAAGVGADTGRAAAFLRAVDTLDVTRPGPVYWAGRLTLCSCGADLARYDACFAHYFGGARPEPSRSARTRTVTAPAMWNPPEGAEGDDADTAGLLAAGETEVLRSADIAALTREERAEVARLVSRISADRPRRRTRRLEPAAHGRLDHRRTLRAALRTGGDPVRLPRRHRSTRPRRVVLLVDISGSMSPYADALLRLAHVVVRGHPRHTEAFSVGTRLTRLTPQMRIRDPGAALSAVAEAIPDWNGGTRLGTELKEFLDLYGRRGAARGAVAVIASDGWERGDAALLGTQMARLSRLAHRVVWVNPHKAQPGYAPLTAGMRAAWPHIDEFVSGHSLDALEQLATAVIGGRRGRGGPRA
ncbi:vWA domain-containing protein [Streptomonospora wellingtoniae]|uniref:VWA domain-containing protein n=1 Tax=Streptomonospora wellingtoniae TaxID=3075544 RepID=A0ABU2KPE1_9ACTN|nr:VWA domain-containing protein [Streptomonospora sp. DSM 45055]MDT0301124.1 VWA domain-containing protein [Streptomonospora sp. DSM 45055]